MISIEIFYLFKCDLNSRTAHPNFDLIRVRTHDLWNIREHFMPLRCVRSHSHQCHMEVVNPYGRSFSIIDVIEHESVETIHQVCELPGYKCIG